MCYVLLYTQALHAICQPQCLTDDTLLALLGFLAASGHPVIICPSQAYTGMIEGHIGEILNGLQGVDAVNLVEPFTDYETQVGDASQCSSMHNIEEKLSSLHKQIQEQVMRSVEE